MAKARRTFILILCVGCARAATPVAHTLRDEAGRTVALRRWPAQRVVSLAANLTEILFAVGAGDRVVGIDNFSNYPEVAVARLPHLGAELQPSVEAIARLTPDVVVLAKTANRPDTMQALEHLGIPAYVTTTERLSQLGATITAMGELVGRQAEARALGARIQSDLGRMRARAAGTPRVRAVLIVWNDPVFVVGRETFASELLGIAGGENVADDAGPGFPKYSLERILRRAPEALIVGSHATETGGVDPLSYWRRWPSLPAVAKNRLYALDGDLLFRAGPRLVDGARALLQALHPELAEIAP